MPTSGDPDYGCNVSLNVPSSLSLDLKSSNGGIEIEGMEADATLDTSNGDINVDMVLPDDGNCILKTSNGSITLSIPNTASANIEARTGKLKQKVLMSS